MAQTGRNATPHDNHSSSRGGPYFRLAISLALSYGVMYAVMYARVDSLDHVYLSLNQAYMAGLMVAPMLLIMLATMGSMFRIKPLNIALVILGVALVVLFLLLIRTQAGVGDRQFLRSMIPHHSGAILVCQEAGLRDAQSLRLCEEIIEAQRREISEMKELLAR
jgi:hypothetical protein